MQKISYSRLLIAAGAMTVAGFLATPASALPAMGNPDVVTADQGIVRVQMDGDRMRHRVMRHEMRRRMMRHEMRHDMRRRMMRHEMRREMRRGDM
jgi:hypothetical protein